jgi:hypothetical protein
MSFLCGSARIMPQPKAIPWKIFLRLSLLAVLLPFRLAAQKNLLDIENWNPGYLVTVHEDTIYGPVIINFQNDLVQINEENTVKAFGANQIQMVFIRENDGENERYFYSFPFHPYSDFKPHKLFEMLYTGKNICLLAREMLVTENIALYDQFTLRTYYSTRTRVAFDFFFFFPEKKQVKAINGSKKQVISLLADKKDEVRKFIKTEKISVNEKEDLVKLATHYNSLKQQP